MVVTWLLVRKINWSCKMKSICHYNFWMIVFYFDHDGVFIR